MTRQRTHHAGGSSDLALIGLTVCVALAAGLAGCGGDKFTPTRYQTIYVGQDQYDVRSKLGRADVRSEDEWVYEHRDPYYKAIIHFRDGFVAAKEWYPSRDLAEEAERARQDEQIEEPPPTDEVLPTEEDTPAEEGQPPADDSVDPPADDESTPESLSQ